MGWSGGSDLMSRIIEAMRDRVPSVIRCQVYKDLIVAFEDDDCDTLQECFGDDPVFVEAYGLVNPSEGGYQAALAGLPAEANPYPVGSGSGVSWKEGWDQFHDDNPEEDDE